jgi:peptidoglycan/xylan/chitin deacetylase (PgdA/CDA1 family)
MAHLAKKLLLNACSLFPVKPLLQLNKGNTLFIPIYHAITDEKLSHLEHLMPYGSKTPKQFENDLDHLLKHLKPISLDTLYDCVVNKKAIPENSFIITFDDGLRQVYENAMPILLRKGVPAVFFINTSVIDNQDLLFRYKSSLIVEQVLSYQKSRKSLDKVIAVLKESNAAFDGNITTAVMKISYKQSHVLDSLASVLDLSWKDYLATERPYMTSAQLQDLKAKGFYLGGHTVHHPELWKLSIEEAVSETYESAKFIKDNYDFPFSSFAFPFTDVQIKNEFFEGVKHAGGIDLMFGSQKLKRDAQANTLQRFDGDNSLIEMDVYIKALLTFQWVNKLRGKTIFTRS